MAGMLVVMEVDLVDDMVGGMLVELEYKRWLTWWSLFQTWKSKSKIQKLTEALQSCALVTYFGMEWKPGKYFAIFCLDLAFWSILKALANPEHLPVNQYYPPDNSTSQRF